jgi:hypothetical protein
LVKEEVIFALVAGSPGMTEEVGEEETGDPEVLESSTVLLDVSPCAVVAEEDPLAVLWLELKGTPIVVELVPWIEVEDGKAVVELESKEMLELVAACTGSKSLEKLLVLFEPSIPDVAVLLESLDADTNPGVVPDDGPDDVSTGSWRVIVRCAGRDVRSVVTINTVSGASLVFAGCEVSCQRLVVLAQNGPPNPPDLAVVQSAHGVLFLKDAAGIVNIDVE